MLNLLCVVDMTIDDDLLTQQAIKISMYFFTAFKWQLTIIFVSFSKYHFSSKQEWEMMIELRMSTLLWYTMFKVEMSIA